MAYRTDYSNGLNMESTKTIRRRPGLVSDGYAASKRSAGEQDPELPGLLGMEGSAAAEKLFKMWEDQDSEMLPLMRQWDANGMRRQGVSGVQLIRESPNKAPKVWAPPAAARVPPTFNMAARLCRRSVSAAIVDPPVAECQPGSGADTSDADAVEQATRVLQDITGPSGLNFPKIMRRALSKGHTFDSGFVEWWVDPKGGGQQPKTVKASKAALTVGEAIYATVQVPVMVPQIDPLTGQPAIDPNTGEPLTAPDPTGATQPQKTLQPLPYVTRYIKRQAPPAGEELALESEPDDEEAEEPVPDVETPVEDAAEVEVPLEARELTDEVAEAELEWKPAVKHFLWTGKNVRMVPQSVSDLSEADMVLVMSFMKWGLVRDMFGEAVEALSDEDQDELVGYRPPNWRDIAPRHVKDPKGAVRDEETGKIPDDAMVCVLKAYARGGTPEYPNGAYICAAGGKFMLHREEWSREINGKRETLPVPISQAKGFEEGEDHPYGCGLMKLLGSGNEVRASIVGTAIETLYRFNSLKTFYSPASLFQPKSDLLAGAYVAIEPGTEPKKEEFQDYPRVGIELLKLASDEMLDEAAQSPISMGASEPEVKSGLHAQKLIEQTNVALSDYRQSCEDFAISSWSIILQLVRAFYTVPMLMKHTGDDNEHRVEEFLGSEIAAGIDVKIARGTMTMLAPSAKMAIGEHMYSLGMIDLAQLKRIAGGNLGGQLGIADNPTLLRVRRQIYHYLEGPPSWMPEEQYAQAVSSIFEPLPTDEEPTLPVDPTNPKVMSEGRSWVRFRELADMVDSARFQRLPAAWQAGGEAEYVKARQSCGVQTIAEQQQAAQMAAQQQADQLARQQQADAQANAEKTAQAEAGAKTAEASAPGEVAKGMADQARSFSKAAQSARPGSPAPTVAPEMASMPSPVV